MKGNLSVISLFSGAMGLDLGLEKAGFEIRLAIEVNKWAVQTIKNNRAEIIVIDDKIEDVSSQEILEESRLDVGNIALVTGGPACQSFSTAGKRNSINDPRGGLFRDFIRVVNDIKPRFFVMENVRGIISSAIKHRPLKHRGPGFPPLEPEEELGSAFRLILRELKQTGYYVVFGVLNSADYGVPQKRDRLILLGSRDGEEISLPEPTHSKDGLLDNGKSNWVTIAEALKGIDDNQPEFRLFTDEQVEYMKKIPSGGNWMDLPKELHEEAIGGAFHSWGGRTGFLRRLSWNEPSPALTTNPNGKATMMCHPEETRPLTVREYARIQQFPDDWRFTGSITQKYTQIGNAVPVGLGKAIGDSIVNAIGTRKNHNRLGSVVCFDQDLINRIAKRPKTILNPPRMRKVKEKEAENEWLGEGEKTRADFHDFMEEMRNVKGFSEIGELQKNLPKYIGNIRRKSRRITMKLRSLYGSPRLGNKENPIDEIVYILLSLMTTEPSYSRVYDRLHSQVGSWEEVLTMPIDELKRIIQDAGLSNQKAPNIKKTFETIQKDFGKLSLDDLKSISDEEAERYLMSLPGIGEKAAKCILLYSFNRQVLPIDTHVRRVSQRIGLLLEGVPISKEHKLLEMVVHPVDRYDFHVNALEHGRKLCRAKDPRCKECSLSRSCNYYRLEINI